MHSDPYVTLGVARHANQDTIKQAYRKLAKIHHPDLNPDDDEAAKRFVEIAEAYSLLKDQDARDKYDQGMAAQFKRFKSADEIVREFAELFRNDPNASSLGVPAGARSGDDVTITTTIDLDEALRGISQTIRFKRQEGCAACAATGSASLTPSELCSKCEGLGHVIQTRGATDFRTHCSACDGQGVKVIDPCATCRGSGRVMQDTTLEIRLLAGVNNGDLIEHPGEGSVGERGGEPGALFVRVEVRPHPFFWREDEDLHCKLPLTYAQAALGAHLSLPTPWGPAELSVPSGTHSGRQLRLPGFGVRFDSDRGNGDLVVETFIHVPQDMTAEERALIAELGKHQDASSAANAFLRTHWADRRDG